MKRSVHFTHHCMFASLRKHKGLCGLLLVGDGDEVVPTVNPESLAQAVEDVGAVVLPFEGWELPTRGHVLHDLQAQPASFQLWFGPSLKFL